MSELLGSFTLVRAGVDCSYGANPALASLPIHFENFMIEYEQSLDHVVLNLNCLNNGLVDKETHNFNPVGISNLAYSLVPENLPLNFQDRDACDMVVACIVSLFMRHLLSDDSASTAMMVSAFKGAPPGTMTPPQKNLLAVIPESWIVSTDGTIY